MERAVEELSPDLEAYEADFLEFFPELRAEVDRFLELRKLA
jgi:hypothetical protein